MSEAERLTIPEFLAKYGDCSGVELVNGRVVWEGQPREPAGCLLPRFRHGVVCYRVTRIFSDFIEPDKLGWLSLNDTFVRTGCDPATFHGTDLIFIRSDRLPSGPSADEIEVAPDLTVMVRANGDSWSEALRRAGQHLNAGVRVAAIVDLATASVTTYRNDTGSKVFETGDVLTLPDVLPGFSVTVARFFEE